VRSWGVALGACALPLAVDVAPGQSGPVGLLVIVVLCVGCVFLFRSMTRQLKRVPRSFDSQGKPFRNVSPIDDAQERSTTDILAGQLLDEPGESSDHS